MFSRSLIEVANYVQARLTGDNHIMVSRVQPFDSAGPGDVALASDIGYLTRLSESRASAFIIPEKLPQGAELLDGLNYLISNRPKLAFARAIELLHGQSRIATGVDASAIIGSDTALGKEVSIYPGVVIGRGCS